MTSVFLSYAEEDAAAARRLVEHLQAQKFKVFWWQDAGRRGGRFAENIENAIAGAASFVALMSPAYMASPWCRRERDLALVRETSTMGRQSDHQFVVVAKVADTDYLAAGFLNGYDWLDLMDANWAAGAAQLSARLRLAGAPPEPAEVARQPSVFRNRDDELARIVNALTTTGGRDLWVVTGPPRLGKTWFLDRLRTDVRGRNPKTAVYWVDLRQSSGDLCLDPNRLLGALLDVAVPDMVPSGVPGATKGALSDGELRSIAAELIKRNRPQLVLLDTADLLDRAAAARLRSYLLRVYQSVLRSGNRQTRLSFVVGGRRQDEWKGIEAGADRGIRFEALHLTEFSATVVRQALMDVARDHDLGAATALEHANRLHRLCEGLPALLVRGLHWAVDTAFLEFDQSDSPQVFDVVVRPYVREHLLSADSLLPFGGEDPAQAKTVIENALAVLSPYRLFTRSHLRYHVDIDSEFRAALDEAGWSIRRLWAAVSNTALLKPIDEMWQEIHPPLRRLLYRYYFGSDPARARAHAEAFRFYQGWADKGAGKEQGVVLLECLWHEAVRRLLTEPDRVEALPGDAADLARTFVSTTPYEPDEFAAFVSRRLLTDEEFQATLRDHDGVLHRLDSAVRTAIQDGA